MRETFLGFLKMRLLGFIPLLLIVVVLVALSVFSGR